MFEVFGRTRSPTLGGAPFWTLKIPYKLAFILPLTAMLTKEPETLQPDAFCKHTMQQNATAAGDPGGEAYSALPDRLAGFKGAASRRGGEEEGMEGKGVEGKG